MSTVQLILYYSTTVVVGAAAVEAVAYLFWRPKEYDWRASLASLADLLVRQNLVYTLLAFGLADPLIGWAWQHRLTTLPLDGLGALAVLFLGQEFCYYWFHRASHRVRWFWASHAVHHSPNQLNLSAAYRFGWTGRLAGSMAFFAPLIWLGFQPRAVFTTLSLDLLYQFLLHATWIPKLGPLEWLLNTPSHHRVHHAANPEYRDANFGGVLIVFDRLFGTFRAERDDVPCRYGLVTPLESNNPIRIAFHEWLALGRDLVAARSFRAASLALLGPPR
jgi:sterol desaturase/sphingolipid hydroxylase (fatty acid hydroxylase superfamily)